MTGTAIPGTGIQDYQNQQSQEQPLWRNQAPSVMVLPTDVELRIQALKLALAQQAQPQTGSHYSEIVKAAQNFYEFLQEGLSQTTAALANGGYTQPHQNQGSGRRT